MKGQSSICENKESTQLQDEKVLRVVKRLLRVSGAALAIWTMGWFNFHYSWVIFGLGIYMFWKWKRDAKKARMESLREVTEDEKKVLMKFHCLPSWVFFPDVERAEWLNQIINQMWPFLNHLVRKILKEKVESELQKKLPSVLKSLYFQQINLGSKNPKVGGIKVYTRELDRSEIIIDVDVIYAGDAHISVKVKGISAGVSDLQLRGKLRVELKPLLPVSPLIGGISIYFIDCPEIDFDLTNLLNVLDFPGLSDILRMAVTDTLCSFMVLPNRINIPLSDDERVESLLFPLPDGMLKIEIIEAADLVARDVNVFTKDSSDPYLTLKVGTNTFSTKTVKDDLFPVWKEKFEMFVGHVEGTRIYFSVFDSDAGSQDEFLGSADIPLESIAKAGSSDMWLPLNKVSSGKIHVNCSWYTFSDNKDDILEAEEEDQTVAALIVKLDSAENLPETNEGQGTSNAACKVTVGNKSKVSRLIRNSVKPVWEEVFIFPIQNPEFQQLKIKVNDEDTEKPLGHLNFNVETLRHVPHMRMKQPFSLQSALPNSTLKLILELKALKMIKASKESKEQGSGKETCGSELRKRNTSAHPEIEACVWYDANKNKLRCFLAKLRYVPSDKETKDLLVRMRLLPDMTSSGLRETKMFKATSDIEEKFSYFIGYEEVKPRKFQIELLEVDTKAVLGKVTLDMEDENLVNPETKWFKLLNN